MMEFLGPQVNDIGGHSHITFTFQWEKIGNAQKMPKFFKLPRQMSFTTCMFFFRAQAVVNSSE